MKKEFYLAFILHSAIIASSVINIISTRSWMSSSGFLQVTETPIYMITLSCVSSMLSLIFLVGFAQTRYKIFPTASAIFSLPFLSVEFFFAFTIRFDLYKFLEQLTPMWINKYTSNEVVSIQKRFKCCGYLGLNDFPNSECSSSYTTPCIDKIAQVLGDPLKGCGSYMLSNAIMRLITIILFFYAYNEEDDTSIIEENEVLVN